MHKIFQLVIERDTKKMLTTEGEKTIEKIQNQANVKISSFSQDLDQIVFSGEDESVDAAINEFLGMYAK